MAGLGVATAVLSSGAVAASLTGIGVVVGVPVGMVGALCGAISTALTEVNKKIEVKKHQTLSDSRSGRCEARLDKHFGLPSAG